MKDEQHPGSSPSGAAPGVVAAAAAGRLKEEETRTDAVVPDGSKMAMEAAEKAGEEDGGR